MSAYFVGAAHVNAMITMARSFRGTSWVNPFGGNHVQMDAHNCTVFGRELLKANIKSLAARYPGDYKSLLPDGFDLDAYRFEPDSYFETQPNAMLATCKLAHCFDYQACEVENYHRTWAQSFTRDLVAACIRRMPGYDAAPGWGYDGPPADAPKVFSLSDMASNFATGRVK